MFDTMHGDMFSVEADVYAHGVNTQSNMDHGVAAIIQKRWPEVFEEYCYRCDSGDLTPGDNVMISAVDGTVIGNVASQEMPGANASIDLLTSGLEALYRDMEERGYTSVSLPVIGGGIGGLDRDECEKVIKKAAENYPNIHTTLCIL